MSTNDILDNTFIEKKRREQRKFIPDVQECLRGGPMGAFPISNRCNIDTTEGVLWCLMWLEEDGLVESLYYSENEDSKQVRKYTLTPKGIENLQPYFTYDEREKHLLECLAKSPGEYPAKFVISGRLLFAEVYECLEIMCTKGLIRKEKTGVYSTSYYLLEGERCPHCNSIIHERS